MIDLQVKQKRAGRPAAISARGFEMMFSIWRFQSIGTKALHVLIAPQDSAYAVSKELIKLEDKGLIFGERTSFLGYQWSITPKGFSAIESVIIGRFGKPANNIEKSLGEFHEREKSRWYTANQNVLVLQQILLDLCPSQNPQAVFSRDLTTSNIHSAFPWLPKYTQHLPDAFVFWPEGRRSRVFAIEYLPTPRGLRRNIKLIMSYRHIKVDGIFLVLENHHSSEDKPSSNFRVALKDTGWRKPSAWHILQEEDLISGADANVYDVEDKIKGNLGKVLGLPDQTPMRKKRLRLLIDDIRAKPKVWGRAYQRD